ncbi:unnamed protein product [Mesocestoides corti]|uniref:Uncharacterized protein n=1 Tax=Mesocestoides corti TaxID=53468 RepID=A0A158QUZ4_MESCO|nr:unnamed protein product [Mesocestoides corti]
MCTCNCTCRPTNLRRKRSLKTAENGNAAPMVESEVQSPVHANGLWNTDTESPIDKPVPKCLAGSGHGGAQSTISASQRDPSALPSAKVLEGADLETELIDLQFKEKELNRLMQLLQDSRNALYEHQQRLQSTAKRKTDQAQQTDLPCPPPPPPPPAVIQQFSNSFVSTVRKETVTQQPESHLPMNFVPPKPYPLSFEDQMAFYGPSSANFRERASFGPQVRTNLISAAFIHRLRQRVQQRRETSIGNGEFVIGGERSSDEDNDRLSLAVHGAQNTFIVGLFEYLINILTCLLCTKSASRKSPLDHRRQACGASPKLVASLAALSLRASPPPPPAPPPSGKSAFHDANEAPPPAAPNSASLKRRANLTADSSIMQRYPTTEENFVGVEAYAPVQQATSVKIKPAIKKVETKEADSQSAGKRSQ